MAIPNLRVLAIGFAISAAILIALFLAVFVFVDAPGEGKSAEVGRARGEVIIRALDAFHRNSSHYPQSLSELAPTYISTSELANLETKPIWSFRYEAKGPDSYELSFEYHGPGVNACTHQPRHTRPWECYGWY